MQIGRLAYREEGTYWNAYIARPGDMKDAQLLGSIVRTAIDVPERKQAFMALMQEAYGDMLEAITGQRPVWNPPIPAPEHERTQTA